MAKKLNRIGEILNEKGITAYRLHKDSRVAYALISAYVKNKRQPSIETLFKLAKALQVNPKDLLNS
jgi:putative transcriptional regulator